jgi:SAM-dependent methyltransferase
MMVYLLAGALPARARVLDLGCGTGSLSERILDHFPTARVVAVDHDPLLLKIGRTALGDRAGRLTWVDADLRSATWAEGLPRGRFDAVVSSTAMHWLTSAELGRLYRLLGRRVRPGGIFLNADHIASGKATPRLRRILVRAWRRRAAVRGPPEGESWREWWRAALADPRLQPEAALHRERFPRAHHRTRTASLPGHQRLLRAAGFREVSVVWSRGRNLILAAVR